MGHPERWPSAVCSKFPKPIQLRREPSWRACAARFGAAGCGLWAVREGGRVVASVGVVKRDARTMELVRLHVRADRRRRGYGRSLLRMVMERAIAEGAARVVLSTPSADSEGRSFYESAGFVVEGVRVIEVGGLPLELAELSQSVEAHLGRRGST